MSYRKWEAVPPQGQLGWTVFGPDGMAANVHTGEADTLRFAASAALLEACEAASDYMGRNIPCDNGGVDYAEDKRRREILAALDSAIRAARDGR